MHDDFTKKSDISLGSIFADIEDLLRQRQESQDLCGYYLLILAALLPFHCRYCPEQLTQQRFGNIPVLHKLNHYQKTQRQNLDLQIDIDDDYRELISGFISTPGCLLYIPNAAYERNGLPINGNIIEGHETPFYDWTLEDTPTDMQRVQSLVIQEINQSTSAINNVLIRDIRRHFPYQNTAEEYMAAFVFMLEHHPRELINGEPCDWMGRMFQKSLKGMPIPVSATTQYQLH